MSVENSVQVGIRSRLIATAGVIVLVPAGHILDRSQRPIIDPSIILGEGLAVEDEDSLARDRWRVFSTLHIWKKEESLAGVRAIAWAIRMAIRPARLELGVDFHCADCRVSSVRYVRDPDGVTSHGILTIETLAETVE
ncbi:DUF3168 domain-containing protein [Sinorhizobium medicae]|uniref:DUF3168 domain-containing protein n=1 Tax=Sinorhizobium medicae TaxID=110321 RepID=A0A6G1WDU1_9HYPH|nr:DUF3168 domain-containing protein [Sinorhizobium medicae]MQW67864.1 DUF3168 domain-containing protein [Sinorhizobium medicae]MQX87081.1 DUF3168 domain-containing protein [Sinorhizobium medicae]